MESNLISVLPSAHGTVTKLLHHPRSTFLISGILICVICTLREALDVRCGGWSRRRRSVLFGKWINRHPALKYSLNWLGEWPVVSRPDPVNTRLSLNVHEEPNEGDKE